MSKFKERAVKFNDGTYGIQTRKEGFWFGPMFLSLYYARPESTLSLSPTDEDFYRCCTDSDLESVQELLLSRQILSEPFSFTPVLDSYEGSSIREFDTEKEVKIYLQPSAKAGSLNSYDFALYEVVQEIDVNQFMKEM